MSQEIISPLKRERQLKKEQKHPSNIDQHDNFAWDELKDLAQCHLGTLSAFHNTAIRYQQFNNDIRSKVGDIYSADILNKVVNLHNQFVNDINHYTEQTTNHIKPHSFKYGKVLAGELPDYFEAHIGLQQGYEILYSNLTNQQAALASIYIEALGVNLNG